MDVLRHDPIANDEKIHNAAAWFQANARTEFALPPTQDAVAADNN